MKDLHAYRVSDDLAAALRSHADADRAFCLEHVEPFDHAHPGHELLWSQRGLSPQGDKTAVGFRDGTTEVPAGLTRASTREELHPRKRSTAGRAWQDVLDLANQRPKVEPILKAFDIPSTVDGGSGPHFGSFRIAPVQWGDGGTDGVLVFAFGSLTRSSLEGGEREVSNHLTAIPLSEFYAIKERLDAERAAAKQDAEATA